MPSIPKIMSIDKNAYAFSRVLHLVCEKWRISVHFSYHPPILTIVCVREIVFAVENM